MTEKITGTSAAIATPDLNITAGQITTTSLQIAEHFGKRHDNVMRAIRNIGKEADADFYRRNFEEVITEFTNGKGGTQKAPAYRITRDGFTMLAMGFTGKQAMLWKMAYLTAFNKMEQELLVNTTRPINPAIDYDRISPAQAQDLKDLVHHIVDAKVQGFAETWARLHKKFRVNSYLELPATRFAEARDYLLAKLPEAAAAAQSDPIDPLNGPALVAARQVAEDYFESYRQAVQAGQPTPHMGEIPQDVLQGMVARALFGQRMLSWFNWSTGTMGCKLIPSDSSVFSLSSGNYFDLLQQVPMERLPELAEAVNQRVACHLGAFTEHLKRNRKPAALA